MFHQLKNINVYTSTIGFFTVFLFFLNVLFPLISDDFCHLSSYLNNGSMQAAINTYTTWNARVGEIISVYFGSYLTGTPFSVINTLVFTTILLMLHPLIYARKGETKRDGFFLVILFTLLSISTVFGAVFLWRAGAMNYAWALALCMAHFSIFRYHYTGNRNWYNTANIFVVIMFCALSFLAGMSSFDLGALGCLIHLGFCIYRRITHANVHARFYLPALFFIIGFLVLYMAPGTQIRAQGIDSYTSLGQIISWFTAFEYPQLMSHYLDRLGNSMYKTNYFIAIASLAVTYLIVKMQSQYRFIAIKQWQLLSGYLGLIIVLIGLLFMHSDKPTGDSLGATILFANFMLSILSFYYLSNSKHVAKSKSLFNEHFTSIAMVIFFHCLMIIDASAYTVGVLPARRAYLTVSVLAAIILAMLVELKWNKNTKIFIFTPLFIISAAFLILETWGLYMTNKTLITEPMTQSEFNGKLIIKNEYKVLKAPQYYDWSLLSTNKNDWTNSCFSRYYGIDRVALYRDVERVKLLEYIDYLSELRGK